jgi:hypothetical protein
MLNHPSAQVNAAQTAIKLGARKYPCVARQADLPLHGAMGLKPLKLFHNPLK